MERLACVYGLAGASIVDVAAEPGVVQAALAGLAQAKAWSRTPPAWLAEAWLQAPPPPWTMDPVVMVSVTLRGDRHTQIAVVEEAGCIACDLCTPTCPPQSIVNGLVAESLCTGCGLCLPACPVEVIRLAPRVVAPDLEACWAAGARGLEIHTGLAEDEELAAWLPLGAKWQAQGGRLAYSIDGQALGLARALAVAKQVAGPEVILQADGKPISAASGLRSTVPAVRLAREMARAGLPGLLQAAGGANDWTWRVAERAGVALAGVGMGSFARAQVAPLQEAAPSEGAWKASYLAARRLVGTLSPSPEALASPKFGLAR